MEERESQEEREEASAAKSGLREVGDAPSGLVPYHRTAVPDVADENAGRSEVDAESVLICQHPSCGCKLEQKFNNGNGAQLCPRTGHIVEYGFGPDFIFDNTKMVHTAYCRCAVCELKTPHTAESIQTIDLNRRPALKDYLSEPTCRVLDGRCNCKWEEGQAVPDMCKYVR